MSTGKRSSPEMSEDNEQVGENAPKRQKVSDGSMDFEMNNPASTVVPNKSELAKAQQVFKREEKKQVMLNFTSAVTGKVQSVRHFEAAKPAALNGLSLLAVWMEFRTAYPRLLAIDRSALSLSKSFDDVKLVLPPDAVPLLLQENAWNFREVNKNFSIFIADASFNPLSPEAKEAFEAGRISTVIERHLRIPEGSLMRRITPEGRCFIDAPVKTIMLIMRERSNLEVVIAENLSILTAILDASSNTWSTVKLEHVPKHLSDLTVERILRAEPYQFQNFFCESHLAQLKNELSGVRKLKFYNAKDSAKTIIGGRSAVMIDGKSCNIELERPKSSTTFV